MGGSIYTTKYTYVGGGQIHHPTAFAPNSRGVEGGMRRMYQVIHRIFTGCSQVIHRLPTGCPQPASRCMYHGPAGGLRAALCAAAWA